MRFTSLASLIAVSTLVVAHPEPDLTVEQRAVRRLEARGRGLQARNCANAIRDFEDKRMRARALKKRGLVEEAKAQFAKREVISGASTTLSAAPPTYTELQNTSCVLAPEVTEGPYYINNELVRQDHREDQAGIPLVIDIGILDINTCEPVPNSFVEIWAANATGVYASYPATLGGISGPPPTQSESSSPSASGPPGGGGAGGPGGSMSLERNETFLRGGFPTDDNGIVEFTTIYTGFYEGRCPHYHTMVHLDWSMSDNGTLVSHSGSLAHIGQFFMDEDWNDQVFALEPYTLNTNNRTLNTEDGILAEQNTDGYNGFLALEKLGDDISEGVLGYITIGIDSTASYSIMNNNYYNSSTESASASASASFASFN
ncbi:aromatic compound dioxygenase [Schizophyllum commune Tattone D]|nr:aromatic compound dioxygenase [Schizophyllum commune Tattone D]